jgi:hypothetical protein
MGNSNGEDASRQTNEGNILFVEVLTSETGEKDVSNQPKVVLNHTLTANSFCSENTYHA